MTKRLDTRPACARLPPGGRDLRPYWRFGKRTTIGARRAHEGVAMTHKNAGSYLPTGLVDEHLRHCVMQAASSGDDDARDEKLAEALGAVERLVRA